MSAQAPALPTQGKGNAWIVPLLTVIIGAFMAILDTSIVNVAITKMMNVFGTDQTGIEWVSTAYSMTLAVVTPLSGWLGARLGLKRIYIVTLAIFTVGSVLCAFAWSLNSMIAFRVIQAIGGGLIMPAVQAVMIQTVPRDRLGAASGLFGLTIILAPAIGPTLGGYLVEYIDWHWIFTINLPIGILGMFLAYLLVPNFPRLKVGGFDWLGAGLVSTGLVCLLLALTEGESWGWGSLSIVMLFYVCIATLGLFVWHQLTTPHPLLNLRLFKYLSFTIGNLITIAITIGLFGSIFYLPLFLQSIRGMGAYEAGLALLPPSLVAAVGLPLSGFLYDRFGPRVMVPLGLAVLAFATLLFRNLTLDIPISTIVLWNCLRFAGQSFAMIPVQSASVSEIPPMLAGQAAAISNVIRNVAGSFGVTLVVLVAKSSADFHTARYADLISTDDPTVQAALQQAQASLISAGIPPSLAGPGFRALLLSQEAKQVFVQSMHDIFVFLALLLLFTIIPAFFLRKGKVAGRGHAPAVAE